METPTALAIGQLVAYVRELTRRLDPAAGWYGEFLRRDPEGVRACLDGVAMPPWDVLESLLGDLPGDPGDTAREAAYAAGLRAAAVAAWDAVPGGDRELRALLGAAAGERAAAETALRGLTLRLDGARDPEEAAALSRELAWTHDDAARAAARQADLTARLRALPHPLPAVPAQRGPLDPPPYDAPRGREPLAGAGGPGRPPVGRAEGRWLRGTRRSAGARSPAPTTPAPPHPAPTPPHPAPAPTHPAPAAPAPTGQALTHPAPTGQALTHPAPTGQALTHPAPTGQVLTQPAPVGQAPTHAAPIGAVPTGGVPTQAAPSGLAPMHAAPASSARTQAAQPGPAPSGPAPMPAAQPGPAPFGQAPAHPVPTHPAPAVAGGMVLPGGGSLPAPRGARFAGAVPAAAVPRREDADGGPGPAGGGDGGAGPRPGFVAELAALREQGRTGEAHALLCEAAAWPAAHLPALAEGLGRAGLAADWATLLWEAASLPPERLAAAAAALGAAGRDADRDGLLRQGVARPAVEVAEAALALGAAGREREVDALLGAFVRLRTAEEAAALARRDPHWFAPRLLAQARAVPGTRHRDLAHALRVAGVPAS